MNVLSRNRSEPNSLKMELNRLRSDLVIGAVRVKAAKVAAAGMSAIANPRSPQP